MHGRGPKAGAPASDAAGMRQTVRPCRVGPRRATWQGPNRADSVRIGRIGLYRPKRSCQAEIKKKKKKRCKRTILLT